MTCNVFRICFLFMFIFLRLVYCRDTYESDDENIQQALLLVNILKSVAYAKLLRENAVTAEALSTCPLNATENATQVEPSTTSYKSIDHTTSTLSVSTASPISSPLPSLHHLLRTAPLAVQLQTQYPPFPQNYRRNFDFPRRRFGLQNPLNSSSLGSSSLATWTLSSMASLLISSRRKTKPSKNKFKIKRKFNKPAKDTENPEAKQIAAELINEFESAGITRNYNTSKRFHRNQEIPAFRRNSITSTQTTLNKVENAFRHSPTTPRIYLEHSTKLSLPLSENNAFCYTNPKNLLCRPFK